MDKIIDIINSISNFIYQLTTPTVSMDYVIQHDGSWSANDFLTDKYVYYWIGDFKTGRAVKVKAIDAARYAYRLVLASTAAEIEK